MQEAVRAFYHNSREIRYSLLLWLSVLALIPFDLDTVDSSRNETLVYTLIEQCKHYLEDSGPTRDAAAVRSLLLPFYYSLLVVLLVEITYET